MTLQQLIDALTAISEAGGETVEILTDYGDLIALYSVTEQLSDGQVSGAILLIEGMSNG